MAQQTLSPDQKDDPIQNPGDAHWRHEVDRYNIASGLQDLENHANGDYVNKGISDAENFANNSSNAIDSAREQEEDGNSINSTFTGKNQAKKSVLKGVISRKNAPGGIIGVLILGGGGLAAFFGVPSLLPVQLSKILQTGLGSGARASSLHMSASEDYMIGNSTVCKGNPTSIGCKLATVSASVKDRFSASKDGMTMNTTQYGDRYMIDSVTTQEGQKLTSSAAIKDYENKTPGRLGTFFRAISPKYTFYNSGTFRGVLSRLSLTRGKVSLESKDKTPAQMFDEEAQITQGNETPEEAQTRKVTETSEEAKAKISSSLTEGGEKAGAVQTAAAVACGLVGSARIIDALAKSATALQYASFAMVFLRAADQLQSGDMDPTTIATLGAVLTRVAASGDRKGMSATDSPVYKAVAYNDHPAIDRLTQSFLLGGNPSLIKLDNVIKDLDKTIPGGKYTIRSGCRLANDPILSSGLAAALCAEGGGIIGSVFPGIGNVIGAGGAAVLCFAENLVAGALIGQIAASSIDAMIPGILNYLKGAPLDYNMNGVDAGTVITLGSAFIFNKANLGYGMQLGNKDQALGFSKLVYDGDQQEKDIALEDAKSTPFDATNEYSFLGQFMNSLNVGSGSGTKLSDLKVSVGSILASAAKLPFASASATTMPLALKTTTLGTCIDSELALKDVACNAGGTPIAVQSQVTMTRSTASNLKYMQDNKYIDEDGMPIIDSDFDKFTKYCTSSDKSVPGTSLYSITDEANDWIDGRCQDGFTDEEISQFQTYTFRTSLLDAVTPTAAPTISGPGLNIMTYNVLGTAAGKKEGTDLSWEQRMKGVTDTVQTSGVDIAGFQEVTLAGGKGGNQYDQLKNNLKGTYSIFPAQSGNASQRPIIWKTSEFTLVDSGIYDYPRYDTARTFMPWVKLQAQSGQKFFVINTHLAAGDKNRDPGTVGVGRSPEARTVETKKLIDTVKSINTQNLPLIATGDYNSTCEVTGNDNGRSLSQIPCTMMRNELSLEDAGENAKKLGVATNFEYSSSTGNVGTQPKGGRHIDHVFYSQGSSVNSWQIIINSTTKDASDHMPVVANISIPGITPTTPSAVNTVGAGGSGSVTGGSTDGDDYHCVDTHYCGQCTDFVLYRLIKHGVKLTSHTLGNGGQVTSTLAGMGYKKDTTPAVHSVMSTYATTHPSLGHTAMVSQVNSDGSIVVEEYNFTNPIHYDKRTISAAEISAKKMTFAHTEVSYK